MKMYKIISTIFLLLLITGCGGGGGSEPAAGGGDPAPTVSGTAATGIALDGVVNVYGSSGGSVLDVPVDASGNYSADVTGLEPPFFLCAVPTNNTLPSQYSWADGPGTTNITPMTTLTLFYANGDQDPASLVNTWQANQASVSMNLPNAQSAVNANFIGIFSAINAALNINFTTYDFFSTGFNIGDVFDQILDLLGIDLSSGTPVITVNGAAFTFAPNIDISGINIGGSGGGSGSGVAGVNPVTPLTSSVTLPNAGLGEFTIESGSDGDIEFVNQSFQLSNGTPPINVVAVQRVQAADISCSDGTNVNGALSSDFSTGVVNLDAAVNSQNVSCTSNFQSILPVIISDGQSITDLLENWGDDFDPANAAQSGLLNTTCPSSVNDDLDIDPFTKSCNGSFLTNYTVTDDEGGTHKLSTKFTFSASSSGGGGGGSTGLGSLTLSGVDTPAIGTSYTPTIQTGSGMGTPFVVVWGGVSIGQLTIGGTSSSELASITFNDSQVIGGQVVVYSYGLICSLPSDDCGNLQVDEINRQAFFNNLQMPLTGFLDNAAMGPVTLNGTLTWE